MTASNTLTLDIVAIDQGHSETKYTLGPNIYESSPFIPCRSFPSAVHPVKRGRGAFGELMPVDGIYLTVDGERYFVGADDLFEIRHCQAGGTRNVFPVSLEYRILFLAALYHVARDTGVADQTFNDLHIGQLVLGLPLIQYVEFQDQAKAMSSGTFVLPPLPGRDTPLTVTVDSTFVVHQMEGPMCSYYQERRDRKRHKILVMDMGGHTFDWCVGQKGRINPSQSGATQRGILSCVLSVCDALGPTVRERPTLVNRVDTALRFNGETILLDGMETAITDYKPLVEDILVWNLHQMLESVRDLSEIDRFLVCGGGGQLMAAAFKRLWPEFASRVLVLDDDPFFANVRGFHRLGNRLPLPRHRMRHPVGQQSRPAMID